MEFHYDCILFVQPCIAWQTHRYHVVCPRRQQQCQCCRHTFCFCSVTFEETYGFHSIFLEIYITIKYRSSSILIIIWLNYTPDIRSMWGYIIFAFPFICSYVRSFVHTFIRSFVRLFYAQGQSFCVKVYKTSYFEDPSMDLVHIWHDGRYRSKIFISTILTPEVALGSRSWT